MATINIPPMPADFWSPEFKTEFADLLSGDWKKFASAIAIEHHTITQIESDSKKLFDVCIELVAKVTQRNPDRQRLWEKYYHICTDILKNNALPGIVPVKQRLNPGDVAYGLAWSFYYGYLKLKLPRSKCTAEWLKEQIDKEIEYTIEPQVASIYGKMVILIPESGQCIDTLEAVGGFKIICPLPYSASRAGNPRRDYKSMVFEVHNQDQSEKYIMVIEYATPVMSMYEMHTGKIANFDEEDLATQRGRFEKELTKILETDPGCNGKVLLLPYKDTDDMSSKDNFDLASLVIKKVKEDIQRIVLPVQHSDCRTK